jgi:hypothetical protein
MNNIVKIPVVDNAVLTPMAMIDRALTSGATPETLGKLMDLQERWEANQAKKAFDEAMQRAQAEMRPVLMIRPGAAMLHMKLWTMPSALSTQRMVSH